MLAILNKEKIVPMVNQFYDSLGIISYNHQPLLINCLSAFTRDYYGVGEDCNDGDFLDDNYAYDYSLGMFIDWYNADTFCIKPAVTSLFINVYMAFEWIANKPVYVTSKDDCIKLYESFAAFLEATQILPIHIYGFNYENMKLELCFSELHNNPQSVCLNDIDKTCLNVLFTEEHFKPKKSIIRTLNGCFQYAERK